MAAILLVEDNDGSAAVITLALARHSVTRAKSSSGAYVLLNNHTQQFDVVIVDRHLSATEGVLDGSGETVLEYAQMQRPEIPRILVSAVVLPGDVDEMKARLGLSAIMGKTAQGYGAPGIARTVERVLAGSLRSSLSEVEDLVNAISQRMAQTFRSDAVGLRRRARIAEKQRAIGWQRDRDSLNDAALLSENQADAVEAEAAELKGELGMMESSERGRAVMAFQLRWDAQQS